MTKREFKKRIEGTFDLIDLLKRTGFEENIKSFRIVSLILFDGGRVDIYYDTEKGGLECQFRNSKEGSFLKKELKEVPDTLTEYYHKFAPIVTKYIWLGE